MVAALAACGLVSCGSGGADNGRLGPGGEMSTGGSSGSGGANSGGSNAGGSNSGGANTGGASTSGTGGTPSTGNGGNAAGTGGSPNSGGSAMPEGGGAGGRSDGGTVDASGTTDVGRTDTGAITGGGGEDNGLDCTIAALPTSGLPTISKLPDPFKKLDGTRMTTKAEWRCRREEMKKMAEKYAFGTKPLTPKAGVTGTVSTTSITVNVSDGGKSGTFTASIQRPTSGTAPYPAIIVYAGAGFGAPLDSTVVNSEGVALINYDPYSVGAEGNGRGATAEKGAFYSVYGGSSATGLLTAWAWGVSRIIDLVEQSGASVIKADAIAVTGCSRFGKGAFLAGVLDERVALTMPIESGTAGVPIWRNVNAEGAQTLSSAYGEQPWFGDAFQPFTAAATTAPLDTHELVAMVAPRGLFIMDNPFIANLGPISAHVAALAGAEVFKALGVGANITYYSDIQNGTHCSQRPEWSAPLKSNIEKFLKKTGNDPGVIKASATATGRLSDWSDWTTPTLQ